MDPRRRGPGARGAPERGRGNRGCGVNPQAGALNRRPPVRAPGRQRRLLPPSGHSQASRHQGLRRQAAQPRAVPGRRGQEPPRGRRVLRHHPARVALLRRVHGPRHRRSDAARTGPLRSEQGPRGRRARVHLRRARVFRPFGASELALVREHPQRASRSAPAGCPRRHWPHGTGLRASRRGSRSPAGRLLGSTSYCLTGDGELQEGPIWEAVMYAGQKHLDNLCVMVDRNNGQLDIANRMVFPMPELERVFASFDWDVHSVDATQYDGVYAALEQFRFGPRNGRADGDHLPRDEGPRRPVRFPEQAQGHGAGRARRTGDRALQAEQRQDRVDEFNRFHARPRRPAGRRAPADASSTSRRSDAPRLSAVSRPAICPSCPASARC